MNARCTGHCCESFWLPLSPMELEHHAARDRLGKPRWQQAAQIAEMVIYQRPDPKLGHRYTCKYFDPKTRNCTNYENRPDMCRRFPENQAICPYAKCTGPNSKTNYVAESPTFDTEKEYASAKEGCNS